ncbi:MAG TPA: FIST N-terminal domain-containing protein, partial [Sorangium sp.]|nr:FIST N-terminal domain-containing protein [Sorangium sp.]
MILETFHYDRDSRKWSVRVMPVLDSDRTLVLVFGAPEFLDDPGAIRELRRAYPRSHMVGCSSAGEIAGTSVRRRSYYGKSGSYPAHHGPGHWRRISSVVASYSPH